MAEESTSNQADSEREPEFTVAQREWIDQFMSTKLEEAARRDQPSDHIGTSTGVTTVSEPTLPVFSSSATHQWSQAWECDR